MALDLAGYAISAGSACSSGKVKPSHVALAMGLGEEIARGAIRVSLGAWNSAQEIDGFVAQLAKSAGLQRALPDMQPAA
jgi:cysteine desulfurase